MLISYCTTCFNRLWQLRQTLPHNLAFTKVGEVELCVLAYNDNSVEEYLKANYGEYIADGRLKVKTMHDPIPFTCGRVKNFSHAMGTGDILFNLDSDNYIANAHDLVLQLKPNQILKNIIHDTVSVSGRIAIHRHIFQGIGGYRDVGRNDDGDFVYRCLKVGIKLVPMRCDILPISNEREDDILS